MDTKQIMDHLSRVNVRAFLKAIRLGEGTIDDKGYFRIVGGANFYDTSKHPNVRVWIPRYKVWSTAAGAYQIINPTWKGLVRQYKFPDFSPDTQDMAAVALIIGRRAIDDIIAGRFTEAVQKCSAEWASLPGSTAGQRIEKIANVRNVYLANGGTITL